MAAPNNRFAVAIHIMLLLAHNDQYSKAKGECCVMSSDTIAKSVGTHPVLIRRLISALKKAKLVISQTGSLGGFRIAPNANDATLSAIYLAVAPDELLSMHHAASIECPVGKEINQMLGDVFDTAKSAMLTALDKLSLNDLLKIIGPTAPCNS